MRTRPLHRYLVPAWLVAVLVLLGGIYWFASGLLEGAFMEERTRELEAQAHLLAQEAGPLLAAGDSGSVARLVREAGTFTSVRYTVILLDGRVVGESAAQVERMDAHFDRPEIAAALAGRRGVAIRTSPTMGRRLTYVAVPIRGPSGILGAARAAMGLEGLNRAMNLIRLYFLAGVLAAFLLAGVVGLTAARRIARPLEEIAAGADRFAAGDFSRRFPLHRVEEIDRAAASLNRMAESLEGLISSLRKRKEELEGVFRGMLEGVLTVDPEERILSLNPAASRLLSLDGQLAGRSLPEAVRHPGLREMVSRALAGEEAVEGEIVLSAGIDRVLRVGTAPLRGGRGGVDGALVVVEDVTRVRRLEAMRREFVANVSHEIRTPITSIKGAVETLLAGAKEDPEAAARFLEMIARHADRLHALVEDLLRLSRIEREEERGEILLSPGPLCDLLCEAAEAVRPLADQRRTPIEVSCPEGLIVRRDPFLLTQAVANLIDNAVKYSEEGRPVKVSAREAEGWVEIEVRDEGCGIAAEHLPRVFERFYRVDAGRSRKMGGTGLGLAIVKHIVSAHHGTVTIVSTPGEGSVFTIRLSA